MALVIPDIQSITNGSTGLDFQAVSDSTDWAAEAAANSGSAYVVSGMGVTQHTGSDMEVSIAAGTYVIAGIEYTYAGGTATISAASASDRRDIVSINAAGTVTVTAGTPCGTAGWTRTSTNLPPVKPAIPANSVLLGEVGVTSSTTVITTAVNVVDKTVVQVDGNYYATYISATQTLVTSTTSPSNVITTGTLGVGTWSINAQMAVLGPSGTQATGVGMIVRMGSAAGTFLGPNGTQSGRFLSASYLSLQVDTIVQVTSAGTLSMSGYSVTTTATVEFQDYSTLGKVTGIVCVRIA